MIQSTLPASYGDAQFELKQAIINVVLPSYTLGGQSQYSLEYYAILDNETGAKTLIGNETKTLTQEQDNDMDASCEAHCDFIGLSKSERVEAKKRYYCLYIMQNFLLENGKTQFNLLPEQWIKL